MADNVAITAGSGTAIAADDIASVWYQRVKVTWGPDGTANDTDVASGKPLPAQLRVADGTAWTYGSGAAAAGTPRVVLATDSPGVTTLGQAAMAASLPVTIASDQAATVGTVGPAKAEDVASANGDLGIPAMAVQKATPANTAGTDGDYEFLQMSAGRLWVQVGAFSASATFTPAAASHVANDVNGAAAELTSMGPSGGRILINSASLEIDGTGAEATAWRLYLYNVTPPSAIADDGAFDLPSGDRASFLGQIELGTAVDLGSTQYIEVNGLNKQVKLAGTSIFAYLVNLTTLTPANVAHIVTLHTTAL